MPVERTSMQTLRWLGGLGINLGTEGPQRWRAAVLKAVVDVSGGDRGDVGAAVRLPIRDA